MFGVLDYLVDKNKTVAARMLNMDEKSYAVVQRPQKL
jgi:hypothetical protein